jgi:hypothetical protein
MSREAVAKTNFNAGEFAPRAIGRTDVDKYYNGVARMQNFIPLPWGGAQRTPGTKFVNEVRNSAVPARLFDWVFGSRQAYILQFNDGYIQFYKDRGIVADTSTKLFLRFNGSFTDSSGTPHTVTSNGGSAISTTVLKFGSGGCTFNGTSGYLSVPDSADWNFGTGNFTVDFFIKFNALATQYYLVSQIQDGTHAWIMYIDTSNKLHMIFLNSAGTTVGNYVTTSAVAFNTTDFFHVCFQRITTTGYIHVNGVPQAVTETTAFGANDMTDLTGSLYIGADGSGGGSQFLNGAMDDVRIVKGSAIFGASTFTPPINESDSSAFDAYEITHVFDDDELFDIQTAQAEDIMYLAHGDNPTQKLSRFGDASWTIANTDFLDGPYLDENTTATTLDPSDVTGSVTVTASAITGINPTAAAPNGSGFQTTDVGRLIRYYDGTDWFWMKITARTSTTQVTATIQYEVTDDTDVTMTGHAATTRWRLGAWSATTGYPRAVAFFQGALWFAGTTYQPQTVWRSVVGDYENMYEGDASASYALTIPLNSEKTNVIQWLASSKRLIAGTEGEIFTVWSGASGTAVTPANAKADPETNYGSSGVTPVKIGSYIYYVADDDITLREFYYDFGIDSYRSVNKSILSDHITKGEIRQMAYQKSPFGIIYAVLEDGKMATFTREIEQEVNGWADQTPKTGDSYESVAAIPVSDGYTEIYFVMTRIIGGATKQYVEYQVNPRQDVESNIEDMVLMQAALTYDGAAVTTISGLEHLASTAVQVLADGLEVTGKTVSSAGVLTLDTAASVVQVGLANTGQIKLLPLEGGSTIGSSQGMEKKVSQILCRVYRSLGLKAGEDGGNMDFIFRDGNGALLTALQTDDFELPSTLGWDAKQQILFENATPFPTTLLMTVLYEFTAEENAG